MTRVSDIYEGGSHQMRHCDTCEIPAALAEAKDPSYSLLKHIIIESRAAKNNPDILEQMRAQLEAQGADTMFDVAQKCLRCAEGMCLLINGNETVWQVGGAHRLD